MTFTSAVLGEVQHPTIIRSIWKSLEELRNALHSFYPG